MLSVSPLRLIPIGAITGIENVRIDLFRVADVADVDGLHEVRRGIGHFRDFARDHQLGVLAGDADRLAPMQVYCRDDLLVDQARQHHLHDLDGRFVGDAQAIDELALQLQPFQHTGDLWSTAVHNDGVHARLLQEHDVLGKCRRQCGVAHRMSAILYDHSLPIVALHMRQGLGENACLGMRERDGVPSGGFAVLTLGNVALGHLPLSSRAPTCRIRDL